MQLVYVQILYFGTNHVQHIYPLTQEIMMSKKLEVLQMIVDDMESDVEEFEGRPFNGKTLGELHGILSATIQALAKILKEHLEECEPAKSKSGGN